MKSIRAAIKSCHTCMNIIWVTCLLYKCHTRDVHRHEYTAVNSCHTYNVHQYVYAHVCMNIIRAAVKSCHTDNVHTITQWPVTSYVPVVCKVYAYVYTYAHRLIY